MWYPQKTVNTSKRKLFIILAIAAVLAVLAGYIAWTPFKQFELGLDLQGGIHLVYEADVLQVPFQDRDSTMQGLRDVIERRVNFFGVKEPLVQAEGTGDSRRLIVELAGVQSPEQAIELIGETPYLEFRELKENYQEIIEKNKELEQSAAEEKYEDIYKPTELTGKYLSKASFEPAPYSPGEYVVSLQFNDEGAKLFEQMTARNIQKPITIFLDFQELQSPVVQEPIAGGKAQISGGYDVAAAREIVQNLNAGSLPVPITLISQQQVGATLGSQTLNQSVKAGMAAFAAILIFMVLFYRLPGVFSCIALVMYVACLLAIFKLIPITLTLAGIAGFILSIGMAVDANILIFSRMREELKAGRSFSASVSEGFSRAWPSIRDGNLTTLLVALALFWFGSSFVQGFAFALSLGIILSMVTAVFVTRNLLSVFIGTPFEHMRWMWK
ncbi:MAG: protein translocase subunit SecD [Candidatus Wildermuthbacteria bacterium]|nr:protein translocase subunit SecD [Candidatus Wildermuthbacteria bacterium]